ncbi:MAG TPA: SRPBCC domain-containing protein [Candidatus Dormibacteraeota bacterium]|nr:SRPBCC domain-containing protein [Candidatus Dormibacteraeota bacterium]HEX2682015.1 SRPBCC domain-containing protein [Candidatus Dormibacteraeota bacterium]
MADDLVFRALADPTRRLLLDRLFDRDGRSLSDLQAQVEEMSRFGVMKHLRILEAAGLVTTRKVGREKLHYLNPVPVQLIHDRWVSKYTRPRVAALSALKETLEGGNAMSVAPSQVYVVFIRATPEQVWDAITKPEFTARYFFGSRVDTTGEVATPIRHRAPNGDKLWGDDMVLESERPRRFVHSWRALYDDELAAEEPSRVSWEIEPQPGGITKLTVVHDQLEGAPKTATSVSGGWMFVLSGMKTLLETGEPLSERSVGAAPE